MGDFFANISWGGVLALTFMEIMLGIDNVIFVSIILDKLETEQQKKLASRIWMVAGLALRLILLYLLSYVINGSYVLFNIAGHDTTLSQAISVGGGLFLLVNTILEMHNKLEGDEEEEEKVTIKKSFAGIVQKIIIVDLVFSFDSIITAIGMADAPVVRIFSVVVALLIMFLFATKISNFISKHPTFKVLALSFLILIGFILIVDGINLHEFHVPHGYIYFAMAFSFGVELFNMQLRKSKKKPVKLNEPTVTENTKNIAENI
jgi:predicted tellurium resistance membrane protein TerC